MKSELNCNVITSEFKSKSIYFTKELISAISVLKESEQSDSAYVRYCVQETINRDHGFPLGEFCDPIVIDRILSEDFTPEQCKKLLAILERLTENRLSDKESNEMKEVSFKH